MIAVSQRLVALLRELAIFEQVADDEGQARCLLRIAEAALEEGEPRRALRACRLGLLALRGEAAAPPGPWGAALRAELNRTAAIALLRRDHAGAAHRLLKRAEDAYREAGQPRQAGGALLAQAVLRSDSDPIEARLLLRRLLAEATTLAAPRLFAAALRQLGELDLAAGRPDEALHCASAATEALLRARIPAATAGELLVLRGRALFALGRASEAQTLLGEGQAALSTAGRAERQAEALEAEAWLQLDRSEQHAKHVNAGPPPQPDRFDAATALVAAQRCLRQALELRRRTGAVEAEAHTAVVLAACHLYSHPVNPAEVLRHLSTALELMGRMRRTPAYLCQQVDELLRHLPRGRLSALLRLRLEDLTGPGV